MKRIICIIGKSAAGKDSIAAAIAFANADVFKLLIPCTTRPMRNGEIDGVSYHFISKEPVDSILAKTVFHTQEGDWYYGFKNEELDETCDYITVLNPAQVKEIKERYKENFQIVLLHIITDEETRMIHAIKREMANRENFAELCRRFLADAADFKETGSSFAEAKAAADEYITVYNDYKMPLKEIAEEIRRSLT